MAAPSSVFAAVLADEGKGGLAKVVAKERKFGKGSAHVSIVTVSGCESAAKRTGSSASLVDSVRSGSSGGRESKATLNKRASARGGAMAKQAEVEKLDAPAAALVLEGLVMTIAQHRAMGPVVEAKADEAGETASVKSGDGEKVVAGKAVGKGLSRSPSITKMDPKLVGAGVPVPSESGPQRFLMLESRFGELFSDEQLMKAGVQCRLRLVVREEAKPQTDSGEEGTAVQSVSSQQVLALDADPHGLPVLAAPMSAREGKDETAAFAAAAKAAFSSALHLHAFKQFRESITVHSVDPPSENPEEWVSSMLRDAFGRAAAVLDAKWGEQPSGKQQPSAPKFSVAQFVQRARDGLPLSEAPREASRIALSTDVVAPDPENSTDEFKTAPSDPSAVQFIPEERALHAEFGLRHPRQLGSWMERERAEIGEEDLSDMQDEGRAFRAFSKFSVAQIDGSQLTATVDQVLRAIAEETGVTCNSVDGSAVSLDMTEYWKEREFSEELDFASLEYRLAATRAASLSRSKVEYAAQLDKLLLILANAVPLNRVAGARRSSERAERMGISAPPSLGEFDREADNGATEFYDIKNSVIDRLPKSQLLVFPDCGPATGGPVAVVSTHDGSSCTFETLIEGVGVYASDGGAISVQKVVGKNTAIVLSPDRRSMRISSAGTEATIIGGKESTSIVWSVPFTSVRRANGAVAQLSSVVLVITHKSGAVGGTFIRRGFSDGPSEIIYPNGTYVTMDEEGVRSSTANGTRNASSAATRPISVATWDAEKKTVALRSDLVQSIREAEGSRVVFPGDLEAFTHKDGRHGFRSRKNAAKLFSLIENDKGRVRISLGEMEISVGADPAAGGVMAVSCDVNVQASAFETTAKTLRVDLNSRGWGSVSIHDNKSAAALLDISFPSFSDDFDVTSVTASSAQAEKRAPRGKAAPKGKGKAAPKDTAPAPVELPPKPTGFVVVKDAGDNTFTVTSEGTIAEVSAKPVSGTGGDDATSLAGSQGLSGSQGEAIQDGDKDENSLDSDDIPLDAAEMADNAPIWSGFPASHAPRVFAVSGDALRTILSDAEPGSKMFVAQEMLDTDAALGLVDRYEHSSAPGTRVVERPGDAQGEASHTVLMREDGPVVSFRHLRRGDPLSPEETDDLLEEQDDFDDALDDGRPTPRQVKESGGSGADDALAAVLQRVEQDFVSLPAESVEAPDKPRVSASTATKPRPPKKEVRVEPMPDKPRFFSSEEGEEASRVIRGQSGSSSRSTRNSRQRSDDSVQQHATRPREL